jgi:hypothetical protein
MLLVPLMMLQLLRCASTLVRAPHTFMKASALAHSFPENTAYGPPTAANERDKQQTYSSRLVSMLAGQ